MSVAALLGWFALIAQLFLTTSTVVAQERTMFAGVITYLSYFTVLTNFLAALGLTLPLLASKSQVGTFFDRPAIQSAIATYIAVVGIVYSALLRHLWQPQGLQLLVDVILHDVIPVAFVLQWLIFVTKGTLRWRDAAFWLCYPLGYVLYSLLLGAITGRYSYPFADVNALGYPQVVANTALLLVGFYVLGLAFVGLDHALAPRHKLA